MSNSSTPSAARPMRRGAVAALWVSVVAALVACDTGSLLNGTAGGNGAVSADATLSSLTVSTGTLTPAFDSGTATYSLAVTVADAFLTVTATPRVPTSTVTINGAVLVGTNTSPSLAIPVGTSNINIVVTASDTLTFRTYSIVVVRPSS
jgi:hypothetical protein